MTPGRVAVLGAGALGVCTALRLAEEGVAVDLFDEAGAPLTGAGRWNEGKIHLGHLYSASGSLDTARAVLEGGLAFRPLMRRLLGRDIDAWITPSDDVYLFHRDSVVSADASAAYLQAVTQLAAEHPRAGDYLAPVAADACRALARDEIAAIANPDRVVAAWRAPERSVSTVPIADALAARVRETPSIAEIYGRRVVGARRAESRGRDAWTVDAGDEAHGPYAAVVNALWHGRPAIDLKALGRADDQPHHRYRVSAFLEFDAAPAHPSAVVAVGPFGDVKFYADGRAYASWYPAGLLAEGADPAPPDAPVLDDAGRRTCARAIRDGLAAVLPGIADLFDAARSVRVEGGWVYAKGRGVISDPASTLHRRDAIGAAAFGTYFTVDTGKYSIAPWLADRLAPAVAAAVR